MAASVPCGRNLPASIDFAFLDSGTGGLPYMGCLQEACPAASCLYLADTKNFPYGEKSPRQVVAAATEAVGLVLSRFRPKALVLACNTMSVTALELLRQRFPQVRFIGTVPAVKVAAERTRNKVIGLLATEATVRHPYTRRLAEEFAAGCRVVGRGDGQLIRLVEEHLLDQDRSLYLEAARPAVDFFLEQGADTIVLGCTHFLHIADEIQTLAGPLVQVVDSREGVVRQALRLRSQVASGEAGHGPAGSPCPGSRFFVSQLGSTRMAAYYEELCRRFSLPWGGVLEPPSSQPGDASRHPGHTPAG